MTRLYERFPKTVKVAGKDLLVKTDFRAVLKMMDCLGNADSQEGKLQAILGLYKERPGSLEEAIKAIADFVSGSEKDGKTEEKEHKKTLSYEKDAPFIASDFLRFYGIDLTSCKYLHWHKFQMLLAGLSEESETKKRMAYRAMDAGKIKNREERKRIQRIQRAISLEDEEADAERIGDLFGDLG